MIALVAVLFLLIGFNFYLTFGIVSSPKFDMAVKHVVQEEVNEIEVPVVEPQVVAGPKGDRGDDGRDGQSVVGAPGLNGKDGQSIQGEKGDPGVAGREIELTRDGESLFWRYVGDDFWTEL